MKSAWVKLCLVTGFGSGLLPFAPGTWASALAAGLWLAAAMAMHASHPLLLQFLTVGGVVLAGAACVALSPWMIRRTGQADPGQVTADELAGQWLAMLWVQPFLGSLPLTAAVQFV
ncbi:MAG: phosphatidylglycerophosphatase A, partial [Phycisphaerae bacterium]|nr:phosphatidylglycerophosphatase A [Phycisphaerae bacterium]